MDWTREYIKNRIKSAFGLERDQDDGLLTDVLIHEAIDDAMMRVADDCNLIPVFSSLPLRQDQWAYPVEEGALSIRRMWWEDTDGTRYRLDHIEPEKFLDGHNPTDTDSQPYFYSYPHYQGPRYNFYAGAPPRHDFISRSNVTRWTRRTVLDSGASFGYTLSGDHIPIGAVVFNVDDDSYGYIESFDTDNPVATGTAGASTSPTLLVDGGKDFEALEVEVGDIICQPDTGLVEKWAWVTEVLTTWLVYADIEGGTAFEPGDKYRVGKCDMIRLSASSPHPGLRFGANNYFNVGDIAVTMTGTSFTNTRCTGSSPSGATVGQIAIASGGAHGKITAVETSYVDVDKWIGGKPTDGETVTIRTCDAYQIQSKFRTERVFWLRPTPNSDDTVGKESLHILYNDTPTLPENDTDPIVIPQRYLTPLMAACLYFCAQQKGNYTLADMIAYETRYIQSVKPYLADVYAQPTNEPLRPYQNRQSVSAEKRNTGRSGVSWNF